MPTIELGELRGEAPSRPRPPARTLASARWLRIAGVLALLLATMAAGRPWPRSLPEVDVPARLGALVFTEGGRLFIADPVRTGQPGQPGQQLAAFRLPGGEPLWRVPLPMSESVGFSALVGDTLVLSGASGPRGAWGPPGGRQGRVVAVDASTGATLWNRAGALEATSTAGDLILWGAQVDWAPPAGTEVGMEIRPGTLQAVDSESGEVRWSMPAPAGARRSYPESAADGVPIVVVSLPAGRVELRDLATGAVLRATQLPPLGTGSDVRWSGEVVGDLFLVRERRSVTAYGLDRLDLRWSVAADLDREFGPVACGDGLCSYGLQGGVRFWDLGTGRTRWADPRWRQVWQAGGYVVAARWVGASRTGPLTVLDPDTGRTLGELGAWQVPSPRPRGSRLTGVRVGPDGRAWVADLDVATRTVRVLGVLHDVSGDCGLGGETLYCRRLDGSIGMWRLRP